MANNVIYRLVISADDMLQSAESQSKATKQATETGDAIQKGAKKIAGYYAATSMVRNFVKTNVGLMEVYTGNSYQQRVIEGAISIAESAIGTGIAFFVNPIAGVMAVASKAISIGADAVKRRAEIYESNLAANVVRQRAGGQFNRSRESGKV